jgi:hypothetical protein
VWLGEAYLLEDRPPKGRDSVYHGLEIARDSKYRYAIGRAHRTLARIVQTNGAFMKAKQYLLEDLQSLTAMHARFEVGRTNLALAALAHAQGNREAAATSLKEAQALFKHLRVPRYAARTAELAKACGVPLSEEIAHTP